jgi:hypothetical protein
LILHIEFLKKKEPNIEIIFLHRESDGTLLKAFPGVAASVKDLNTANLPGKLPNLLSNGDQIKLKITDPLVIYEIYRYKYFLVGHTCHNVPDVRESPGNSPI